MITSLCLLAKNHHHHLLLSQGGVLGRSWKGEERGVRDQI